MRFLSAFCLAAVLAVFGTGCASTGGGPKGTAPNITMPPAGKARVVFLRPSSYAYAIHFGVHDGENLIGVMTASSYFTYDCEPGKHLFGTSMEDVALLDADLLPDRIYYVKVSAAMGAWIAQVNMYSIHPNCAGNFWEKMPKALRGVRESHLSSAGIEKDKQGIAHYMERVNKAHPKYLNNPNREQILPEHGQLKPIDALGS